MNIIEMLNLVVTSTRKKGNFKLKLKNYISDWKNKNVQYLYDNILNLFNSSMMLNKSII